MKRVFVNGTFDILHHGHLCLLNFARAQGDHLLVGIDSDFRVRDLKGPDRPYNSQEHRYEMLINLRCVDEVVVFDSDDELLSLIDRCDVMVKGSDYQHRPVIGQDRIHTIFYPRIDKFASSSIIESLDDRG